MSRQRLSRNDWIQAALDALARGGVAAVRVDVLAKDLGITRGSFYWHFADRDALLAAALEEWERTVTTETIERLERVSSPIERYREIMSLAFFGRRTRDGVEPALAAHADHPIIAPVLRRATAARFRFLTELYADLGLPEPDARHRALITYAAFVGWLELRHIAPDVVPELMAEGESTGPLADHVDEVLLADVSRARARAKSRRK